MSSLRRVQSSKANGALSKGPTTPAGKQRSSLNALRHGLCAKCIVLDHESRENFLILLQQHVDLFQPANEVEFGMIEEMCAAYWRQRRAWTIETALLDKHIALQSGVTGPERMAAAFDHPAAAPTLPLLYRETRQHLMYQRALRTLAILRTVKDPNDPSPISEHSPVGQPILAAAGFQPAIAPRTPLHRQPTSPPKRPAPNLATPGGTGLLARRPRSLRPYSVKPNSRLVAGQGIPRTFHVRAAGGPTAIRAPQYVPPSTYPQSAPPGCAKIPHLGL
jgi:hypothetical protein